MTIEMLALFVGIQVVLTGLVAYLGKLWLARVHETLKADVERSLNGSRAGFDVELRLYQDLWAKAAAVRRGLRLGLAAGRGAGNPASEIGELVSDVDGTIDAVRNLAEMQRPFFAPEVAEQIDLVTEQARHWSVGVSTVEPSRRTDWFMDEGAKHLLGLRNATDALCEAIRARIVGR